MAYFNNNTGAPACVYAIPDASASEMNNIDATNFNLMSVAIEYI